MARRGWDSSFAPETLGAKSEPRVFGALGHNGEGGIQTLVAHNHLSASHFGAYLFGVNGYVDDHRNPPFLKDSHR